MLPVFPATGRIESITHELQRRLVAQRRVHPFPVVNTSMYSNVMVIILSRLSKGASLIWEWAP